MRIILLLLSVIVSGCTTGDAAVDGRWYTPSQVNAGKAIFANNCATCHGQQAQGLAEDWRKTLPDGSYPPPPLNGTAHAWHHPMSQLRRSVRDGGIPLGGKMPPFKEKLAGDEIDLVIAFFQSHWSEEVYHAWLERGGMK